MDEKQKQKDESLVYYLSCKLLPYTLERIEQKLIYLDKELRTKIPAHYSNKQ